MAENTLTHASTSAPADLDALRTSPAAHLADAMAAATVTGERSVALREIAFAIQLGLRAVPGSASAAALEAELGLPLPAGHGQVSGDPAAAHVLWLGPDEFLAVDTSRRQAPGAADAYAAALAGLPGQAVDLSANRTILELSGASARQVLEKGCHADLHPRAFPVNTAIATQVGPVPVVLHRTGEREYRLYPRASFADYLVRWLLDAMSEFAGEEVR
ncbi:sarcosine oxidase subunit gamma [Zafaria cholistanensis]|uniref:Sarcosine oxidase subunit gamma n=1 Tax=Zafaria cholistanensis TaxID=1682741 RepID=A0A5A7NTZ9_9MICC|nr:sarcosine oxidase subunit gamma family protein [Zafaria cholistanensis]GER24335.1 sarcosine oxidase subunit gamma [Zafaria cholistanensis]